jgi:hypothetical protein
LIVAVRSPAHDDENDLNPNVERARIIGLWLSRFPLPTTVRPWFSHRARELAALGLGPFDTVHLTRAEALKADVLATTDDRLISRASKAKVASPVREMPLPALRSEVLR